MKLILFWILALATVPGLANPKTPHDKALRPYPEGSEFESDIIFEGCYKEICHAGIFHGYACQDGYCKDICEGKNCWKPIYDKLKPKYYIIKPRYGYRPYEPRSTKHEEPIIYMYEEPEHDKPEEPEHDLPEEPESDTHGEPEHDMHGEPEHDLHGEPRIYIFGGLEDHDQESQI